MVTIDVRDPGLAAHRPGERGHEPGARGAPGWIVRLYRRHDRHRYSARDRDPALDSHHSVVDGPGGVCAAGLGHRAGVLRDDPDLFALFVDGAGARRARPLPI